MTLDEIEALAKSTIAGLETQLAASRQLSAIQADELRNLRRQRDDALAENRELRGLAGMVAIGSGGPVRGNIKT